MLHFQEVLSIYKIEFLRELTIATTYLGKSGFSLLGGIPPTSRKCSHKAPNTPVDSPLHQIFIPLKRQSPPPAKK